MSATTNSITLMRVIQAPIQQIFAAWTDAAQLEKWLTMSAESDAQLGGHYRLATTTPDGETHVVTGEYQELEPNHRLRMTWVYHGSLAATGVAESELTIELHSYSPEMTELALHHERFTDANYAHLLRNGGWTAALDGLEALCTGVKPAVIGQVPDAIERDIFIAAPVARVWEIVTEMRHLDGWTGGADLRPGLVASFPVGGDARIYVQFETVEPPVALSYRWARPAGEKPRPDNSTLVAYTLTAEGNGTRLRVVESGFASLTWPAEEIARYAKGNTDGWSFELNRIQESSR